MATGTILLPIEAACLPDGSANNAAAQIQRHKSSVTTSLTLPAPHWFEALFDAATDEMLFWSFRMPQNYASAPVAKIQFKMVSAFTGAVVFEVRVMKVTPASAQDVDVYTLAATNASASTTVPT